MALRTGRQYRKSLRDGRQILYDGVAVDVLKHPGFRKTVNLVSQFYDFQNAPAQRDVMSFRTRKGARVGMAFLEARSIADLYKKADAYAAWARVTCGMMGRSPDYMNTCVASLYGARHRLGRIDPAIARKVDRTYHDLREKDLCLTHTFGSSHRHARAGSKVVLTKSGAKQSVVITGARGIATLAPFANGNLNIDIGIAKGTPYWLAFLHPVNLPGLRWVCREFVTPDSTHTASPLASRADEMDCIAIFDDCAIPEEGFLFYHQPQEAGNSFAEYEPFLEASLQHHVLIRSIHKTRFLLGLAHLIAEACGSTKNPEVSARLGEIVQSLLILQALAIAVVENAVCDPDTGAFHPNPEYALSATTFSGQLHSKVATHIRDLGASRLLSTPQKSTFDVFGAAVEAYFRGNSGKGEKNSHLFRLAWDVTGSEWAARQLLYERFHLGPPDVHYSTAYRLFDKTDAMAMVSRILKKAPTAAKVFPDS